jgi:ferredoxin
MGFRVEIDRDECMSAGKCIADFPTGFEFDDDELAGVKPDHGLTESQMRKAARNCPSRALALFDGDGERVEP